MFTAPSALLYVALLLCAREHCTVLDGAALPSATARLKRRASKLLVGQVIVEREQRVAARAMAALVDCPGLKLLGNTRTDRLPVFSFVVLHEPSGRYLHHNFVATLLNDLFGVLWLQTAAAECAVQVQARAGCACAGPYAQWLLGIDLKLARELENCVLDDRTGLAELLTDKARRGAYCLCCCLRCDGQCAGSGRELLRPGG